jgi:hypothetical protein
MFAVILFALAASTPDTHWKFAAVPRLTLSADEGIGLGARGTAFLLDDQTAPYKLAVSAQVWVTTKLVQHHFVRIDWLNARELPVRFDSEIGLFTSPSFTFCGDLSTCADDDEFRLRSVEPYAHVVLRARVWQSTQRRRIFEVFGGVRATLYTPGTLLDDDNDGSPDLFPTPGSLYASLFPNGEPGLSLPFRVGVAYDTRDDEIDPRSGVFADIGVRGASTALGSAWTFGGVTATLRLFTPLAHKHIVVAQRLIVDGVSPGAPTREKMRVGGLFELQGLGGQDILRGVRLDRFLAPWRFSHQLEVRVDLFDFDVWSQRFTLLTGVFGDAAATLSTEKALAHFSSGITLRLIWNRNFVMRFDLAISPDEFGRTSVYSAPGHSF